MGTLSLVAFVCEFGCDVLNTCSLNLTRIYSILCPASIRTIEQKCLAGNSNRPFCNTTYCDAHCECVKHRSCPLLHRFISE